MNRVSEAGFIRIGTVAVALVALLVGAAGSYLWQNRAVRTLTDERDAAKTETAALQSKIANFDSQMAGLQADKGKLESQLESATTDRTALISAVQIATSPKDVAIAFGKATLAGNQPWVRALMTPDLASSYLLRKTGPDMAPSRYSITNESKAGVSPWTGTVRVWYSYRSQGETGYTDDILTVAKVGDFYKIQAVKTVDYLSLQGK